VFSHIFEIVGAKCALNSDVFCPSETQNHGIYDVFASGSKERVTNQELLQCRRFFRRKTVKENILEK
jgi:hypothetical protein